jgi:diaminohydroxyphosphoribosylaminopyrimidine deaminase/5-amino-6-(5-phosphoribosylamino)uracil reductase
MPAAPAEFDTHMMDIALRLALRGLGQTAPNPSVGAVIADEATGQVIARGTTARGGRPHAETVALARAGARARGATLYVTLEPCSHHGATPPCADAVIASGIRRVVCAVEDPDPRVGGRGFARLRTAGIAVERGLMGSAGHWMAAGHILRVTERRPFVQLKLAVSADGCVPRGQAGSPAWVTSPEARAHGQLLRARADAVLVGRRTVIDDDPLLTCRLPGLSERSPIRVVLGRSGAGLEGSRLVKSAHEHPVWLFCEDQKDAGALIAQGVRMFPARAVGGEPWLPSIMEALVEAGVTRLLVEGGPGMWRAFSDAGLIDEAVVFQARGAPGSHVSASEALARYVAMANLQICGHREAGEADMITFRRRWLQPAATVQGR